MDPADNSQSFLKASFNSDVLSMASIIPVISPGIDQNAFRNQRICKVCGLNLKDKVIHTTNRRYHCKFCFEAVCSQCSTSKVYSTLTGNNERICIACLNMSIESAVRQKINNEADDIAKFAAKADEVSKIEAKIIQERINEVKNRIFIKRRTLEQANQSKDMLLANYVEDCVVTPVKNPELKELFLKMTQKQAILVELENKEKYNKKLMDELYETRNSNDTQLKKLLQELSDLNSDNLEEKRKQASASTLETLKSQILVLNGIKNTYIHDISLLKRKSEETHNSQESCLIQ